MNATTTPTNAFVPRGSSPQGVNVNASLLMLSVMMIALPSLIGSTGTEAGRTGDTEVRPGLLRSLLTAAQISTEIHYRPNHCRTCSSAVVLR